MRPALLTVLSCLAVTVSGGCTGDAPSTRRQVVEQACRELTLIAEPYAVNAQSPPFDLQRPTSSPEQWRADGRALVHAAEPLAEIGGTRLRDLAAMWTVLGEYLIEVSSDPDEYDTDVVAERLYPADGGCASAVEEAV